MSERTNFCTEDEREVLDRLYEESQPLREHGIAEFDGEYVHWNEIIAVCVQAWPNGKDPGYAESPTEYINQIINERDDLRAQLAAVTAERDEAQGMIHGAKELVSEALRALKHAEKAITREAWQSGPTIAEAGKVILDASKNIEEYGVEGYAGALKLARQAAVMRMNALRSANDALKAAIERAEKAEAELAVWRKWADEIDEDNGNPKGSLKDSIAREATDAARKGTT